MLGGSRFLFTNSKSVGLSNLEHPYWNHNKVDDLWQYCVESAEKIIYTFMAHPFVVSGKSRFTQIDLSPCRLI